MSSYKHINMSPVGKIEGSDDLLTKILLFLPARPLFRFKLVSKRWMSLISDPHFSSLWKPESFPSALILESSSGFYDHLLCCITDHDDANFKANLTFLDFIKEDSSDNVEILNSCSGLILCRIRDKYIVCNPTTKEFHTLPSPNVESLNMSLAFDHSISPHYRVINVGFHFLIHEEIFWYSLPIEIYSSDTNSWSRSQSQFPKQFLGYLGHCKGVFFNGAIFWIFRQVNSFCYFDVDREILNSYEMPQMDEEYYFGCVHGNLHLVGSSVSDLYQINIFVLGNDYSSWSLKYCIDRREPTSCAIRKMICSWSGFTSSCIKLTFTVLSLMASEGNQQLVPYLALYMPRKVKFTVKGGICEKLTLPSVHHLIENSFWIGSKLSNIGQ